jgi:hypothetical protein
MRPKAKKELTSLEEGGSELLETFNKWDLLVVQKRWPALR